jgi:hypothetical protein
LSVKKEFRNVDDYIAFFLKNVQVILEEFSQCIKDVALEAEETISYQMPAFKQNGILVWFAAFKNHIGFFLRFQLLKPSKRNWFLIKQAKVRSNSQSMNQCLLT